MRLPTHLPQSSTFRSEPIMVAVAAVAVGMFIGTWVIGPAITQGSTDQRITAPRERTTFEAMVARPDPMPYRAATPAFDMSGPPNYAAVAKEKAQAVAGGQSFDDELLSEAPSTGRASSRHYRAFDRHRVY